MLGTHVVICCCCCGACIVQQRCKGGEECSGESELCGDLENERCETKESRARTLAVTVVENGNWVA